MARKHRDDRGLFQYHLATGALRYGVRLYYRGVPHKWSGFIRKQEARDWYEDRRRDIREGRPFDVRGIRTNTVRDMIERYLVQVTYKKGYAGEVTYGAFWTAQIGEQALRDPLTAVIDDTRTQLLKAGNTRGPLSHATVNRYVAWLHHVFQLEVNKGTLDRNPCRLEKFTEKKAPEVEFSEAEELAIAEQLGEQADYPTLAILTGLRQGEQFALAWKDLDLDRGYGMLHDPKAGEPQPFLLNVDALAILARLKQRAGSSPWVFPSRKDSTQHLNPKSWYNHIFKAACLRAGITLSRSEGKTYHTLRHTFASRLQKAGVAVKDVKDLGRWKSWKAMDRYLKRDVDRLRGAIERLGGPQRTAHKPPIVSQAPKGDRLA